MPRWSVALLAGLFPVLALAWWCTANTQLPMADAAGFLQTAQHIYQRFEEGRIIEGLRGIYTLRSWRPVAFHLLEFIWLPVSGDNLLFAMSMAMVLCAVVTGIYAYALLRLGTGVWPALIGANIIGMLPSALFPAGMPGFAECALLPAILGTFYHLIRCDFFYNRRHSWGFILAITSAFLIRPVEAALHLGLPLLLFLYAGAREGKFTYAQLFRVVQVAVACAAILCIAGLLPNKMFKLSPIAAYPDRWRFFRHIAIPVIIVAAVLVLPSVVRANAARFKQLILPLRRGKPIPPRGLVVHAMSAFLVAVMLWYVPVVPETVEWVYETTWGIAGPPVIGDVPRLTAYRLTSMFLDWTGRGVLALLLLPFIVSLLPRATRLKFPRALHSLPVYLLAAMPVTIVLTFITIQNTPRKYSIIFPLLILMLLMQALRPGAWQRLRIVLACAVVAVQVVSAAAWLRGTALPVPLKQNPYHNITTPVTLDPNPHQVVMDFLNRHADGESRFTAVSLPLVTTANAVDPFLLLMMINVTRKDYYGVFPVYAAYEDKIIPDIVLGGGVDHILLIDPNGPIRTGPQAAKEYRADADRITTPSEKITSMFLSRYASGELEKMGARKIECIRITNAPGEACLLGIQVKK